MSYIRSSNNIPQIRTEYKINKVPHLTKIYIHEEIINLGSNFKLILEFDKNELIKFVKLLINTTISEKFFINDLNFSYDLNEEHINNKFELEYSNPSVKSNTFECYHNVKYDNDNNILFPKNYHFTSRIIEILKNILHSHVRMTYIAYKYVFSKFFKNDFIVKYDLKFNNKIYDYIKDMKFHKKGGQFIFINSGKGDIQFKKRSLKINSLMENAIDYKKGIYTINEHVFYKLDNYKSYIDDKVSYKITTYINGYQVIFDNKEETDKIDKFINNFLENTTFNDIQVININKIQEDKCKFYYNDIGKIFYNEIDDKIRKYYF